MRQILKKHKPEDSTEEDFEKTWENASYVFSVLYNVITSLEKEIKGVKNDDFDCPNHYAKLMWKEGQLRAYDQIKALLPNSAKEDKP